MTQAFTPSRLSWLVALAAAALVLVSLGRDPAAAQQKADAVKWEYKVLEFSGPAESEKELNKLGDEGWELAFPVSKLSGQTFPESPRAGRNDPGRIDTANHLILRRAKR